MKLDVNIFVVQAVHALLKVRGVDVNLGNHEECSPLQYAAVKGDVEVLRWLVRKGAQVKQKQCWGYMTFWCGSGSPDTHL
jgi:ankyrin repeat protein